MSKPPRWLAIELSRFVGGPGLFAGRAPDWVLTCEFRADCLTFVDHGRQPLG